MIFGVYCTADTLRSNARAKLLRRDDYEPFTLNGLFSIVTANLALR